jgi:uncharacterized protein YcnI
MKKTVVILAAFAAVLAMAAPAFAHEEINPKQFPTGTPTFFTLSAANEKKVNLTKITITAPKGVSFGATTRSPAGWTVDASDTVITWTGGAVKPDNFDQWGYEIDSADQPGTLTYKVTLGFGDGSSDDVNVQTTAVAPGTATTVAGGGAVTTAATSGSTAATIEAKSDESSTARTRANIALVLGAVGLLAAIVALVLASRKSGGAGTSAPAGAGGGQKQDW